MEVKQALTKVKRRELIEYLKTRIVDQEEYQQRPYTCVVLGVDVWNKPTSLVRDVVGFSKVCYPDQWDSERGIELAKQKALSRLAKELLSLHKAVYLMDGKLVHERVAKEG